MLFKLVCTYIGDEICGVEISKYWTATNTVVMGILPRGTTSYEVQHKE